MKLRLDPASPVPLYHQIVEALRYRIATGEHGLSASELAALLGNWRAPRTRALRAVRVIECNLWQCEQHAREIEAVWDVRARPWTLDSAGAPPEGPLFASN